MSSTLVKQGGLAFGSNLKSGGINCGQTKSASGPNLLGRNDGTYMRRDEARQRSDINKDTHLRGGEAVSFLPIERSACSHPIATCNPTRRTAPSLYTRALTLFTLPTTPSTTSPLNGR